MRTHLSAAVATFLSLAAGLLLTEAPAPHAAASAARNAARDPLAALRSCESGGDYRANTGNGYYGAYQFTADAWHSLGYRGLPNQAAPAVQDEAAARLQARSGWSQWPGCSAELRLPPGPVAARPAPAAPRPPVLTPTGPVARLVGQLAAQTLD
jgi:hypothetical protein